VVTVAPITESDLPEFVELMEEMDRFYGVSQFEPVETRTAHVRTALFGDRPSAEALVARNDDRLVGLASYSLLWPAAGLTTSLFLKELYVAEATRAHGVGRALMERLFAVAAERGCSRVEWMTEKINLEAQAFYAQLGHKPNDQKLFYRVEDGLVSPGPGPGSAS
jgi:GNAT superfamily N-acetyltransferase